MRRSILLDAKADLLVYGNAERAIVEIAHRLAAREPVENITDLRGTAFVRARHARGLDRDRLDERRHAGPRRDHSTPTIPTRGRPGRRAKEEQAARGRAGAPRRCVRAERARRQEGSRRRRARTVIRMPSFEQVARDPVLYAHASRVLHLETNPGNARALVQRHGDRDVWLNPPPIPLTTAEMDHVYELPYARAPHPATATPRSPPTR